MISSALILVDPNELRTAAFAAFLAPWVHQAETDLHVVHDPEKLADLPAHRTLACLYSIGGLSLRDQGVSRTIERIGSLFPDSPLIVFSDIPDSLEIAMAICMGLRGFIPTTMPSHIALAAIQFILNGGTYHPHSPAGARPAMTGPTATMIPHIDELHMAKPTASGEHRAWSSDLRQRAANPFGVAQPGGSGAPEPSLDPLTKRRHVEVLGFLAQGETNKEIARHLNLTEATIKVYVRELMRHFGAKNRMQVALKASSLYPADANDWAEADKHVQPSLVRAFTCATGF